MYRTNKFYQIANANWPSKERYIGIPMEKKNSISIISSSSSEMEAALELTIIRQIESIAEKFRNDDLCSSFFEMRPFLCAVACAMSLCVFFNIFIFISLFVCTNYIFIRICLSYFFTVFLSPSLPGCGCVCVFFHFSVEFLRSSINTLK